MICAQCGGAACPAYHPDGQQPHITLNHRHEVGEALKRMGWTTEPVPGGSRWRSPSGVSGPEYIGTSPLHPPIRVLMHCIANGTLVFWS